MKHSCWPQPDGSRLPLPLTSSIDFVLCANFPGTPHHLSWILCFQMSLIISKARFVLCNNFTLQKQCIRSMLSKICKKEKSKMSIISSFENILGIYHFRVLLPELFLSFFFIGLILRDMLFISWFLSNNVIS
jgi:hypothetical protein